MKISNIYSIFRPALSKNEYSFVFLEILLQLLSRGVCVCFSDSKSLFSKNLIAFLIGDNTQATNSAL